MTNAARALMLSHLGAIYTISFRVCRLSVRGNHGGDGRGGGYGVAIDGRYDTIAMALSAV